MRTKLTINTKHGVSFDVRNALNPLLRGTCISDPAKAEDSWFFATREQASEAVERLAELQRIIAEIRVTLSEDPGCLDQ